MSDDLLAHCLIEVRDPKYGGTRQLTIVEVATLYDILQESIFPDEAQSLADVFFEGVVL